jgi:XTP/dITP diphosphohydrolase
VSGSPKRIVVASSNPGKVREFRELLTPLGFVILTQSELGIADAEEPHHTFVENALAKARHASAAAAMPAIADDSGICVHALGGAPGVNSAYFAGVGATREERDAANNAELMRQLRGASDRRAHYYSVVVMVQHANDPEPLIAEGRWHGMVAEQPSGVGGFGYDPYFIVSELGRTAASLQPHEKNAISHRGRALGRLVTLLTERSNAHLQV